MIRAFANSVIIGFSKNSFITGFIETYMKYPFVGGSDQLFLKVILI